MVDTNFCINIVRRQRKGPLWEGDSPQRGEMSRQRQRGPATK